MNIKISAHAASKNDYIVHFNIVLPNICPHCSTGIQALHLSSFYVAQTPSCYNVYSLFLCPTCEHCFLAYYHLLSETSDYSYPIILFPYSSGTTTFQKIFHLYLQILLLYTIKLKELKIWDLLKYVVWGIEKP